jgi:hypothetical protein
VFRNTEVRSIFGPKMEEVTGGWSRVYAEKLLNCYFPPNNVKVIE